MASSKWRQCLDSPVMMTWGSLSVRLLGPLVVFPLVLNRLSTEETALWFLFYAIVALHGLADFGFSPTFIRSIAYAHANQSGWSRNRQADDNKLLHIVSSMRRIYKRIALMGFVLLVPFGSLALIRPISKLAAPNQGWLCWVVVVVVSYVALRGGMYSAYLQGAGHVALCRRWEVLTGLLAAIASVAVLLLGGGLIGIVVIGQLGIVLNVLVNRRLVFMAAPQEIWICSNQAEDPECFRSIWSPAWRSGLGVLMTHGTIQGAGVLYAQIAPPASVASFLLAQRLLQTLSSFANVPYYAHLPTFARLYAEKRLTELVDRVEAGMLRANWMLVFGIAVLGFGGPAILELIGSKTPFVSSSVWWVFGLAILLERIGAMHLQLYSTTNKIVWHIASGISGAIMLCAMPLAYGWLGLVGLPLGILLGNALFYMPYSMSKSYGEFRLSFAQIDLGASLLPVLIIMICVAISLSY